MGALVMAAALARATISEAQTSCCYCDNCPAAVGPFCTDLTSSSASCADLCIVQRGCAVLEFSPQGSCGQGCGSKPPFFSPTPTATPTETVTATPTISRTPTITRTPRDTPTPHYCCQGTTYCRTSNQSNIAMCPDDLGTPRPGETPVLNAVCDGSTNLCAGFSPTPTATNTVPTKTPAATGTPVPPNTLTPTVTQTPTVGGFAVDPYSCYRVKASKSSAAKGMEVRVVDQVGNSMKRILKPQLVCSPADVDFDNVAGPIHPVDHFTCYKIKDMPKAKAQKLTMRNELDEALPVDVIKGDLLCVPSYRTPAKASSSPTPTASVSAAATATP